MRQRVDRLGRELSDIENVVLLNVAESTHRMATRLISEMDEEEQELGSTLIIADRQEAGTGRGNSTWQSPVGGLYLNWLRSGIDAETTARLPMLAAAAAHRALTGIGLDSIDIKWPNDLLVAGKKIAGILVFARHGDTAWVTVGLGVNIAETPSLDDPEARPAISVSDVKGHGDIDAWRQDICCVFVRELTRSISDPGNAIATWRARLIHQPGDQLRIRLGSGAVVEGDLVEITADGHLRLAEDGSERVVTGGDIVEG